MPDPRFYELRSVLWIILAAILVELGLCPSRLWRYIGRRHPLKCTLLGAAVLGAAVMATFFYRLHRR